MFAPSNHSFAFIRSFASTSSLSSALTPPEYSIAPSIPRKSDIARSTSRWGVDGAVEAAGAARSAPIAGAERLATSRSADEEDVGRDDASPTVPSVDRRSASPTRVSPRASPASSCGGTTSILSIPQSRLRPGRSTLRRPPTAPPPPPPQRSPLLSAAPASQAGMTS